MCPTAASPRCAYLQNKNKIAGNVTVQIKFKGTSDIKSTHSFYTILQFYSFIVNQKKLKHAKNYPKKFNNKETQTTSLSCESMFMNHLLLSTTHESICLNHDSINHESTFLLSWADICKSWMNFSALWFSIPDLYITIPEPLINILN